MPCKSCKPARHLISLGILVNGTTSEGKIDFLKLWKKLVRSLVFSKFTDYKPFNIIENELQGHRVFGRIFQKCK